MFDDRRIVPVVPDGVSLSVDGISIISPLLAVMLAGYVVGRLGLLPGDSSRVIGRFVFLVAMPSFILASLTDVPIAEFFNWPYLAAVGGGMMMIFVFSIAVAGIVFDEDLTTRGLHALAAMFSSTAYIGLPLILVVFGEAGLVPGIVGAVITGAVFMPITIVLAEIDKGRGSREIVVVSLLAVVRSPLLAATAAGLLISASNVALPTPATDFLELLGSAFIPCALFAAGLFIAECTFTGKLGEISWLVFVKMLLHPLATWWLAFHVFELEGILPSIAVLQAALPSGIPVFIIAQHYDRFVSRSSAVIALSTVLSVLTLPVLVVLLV